MACVTRQPLLLLTKLISVIWYKAVWLKVALSLVDNFGKSPINDALQCISTTIHRYASQQVCLHACYAHIVLMCLWTLNSDTEIKTYIVVWYTVGNKFTAMQGFFHCWQLVCNACVNVILKHYHVLLVGVAFIYGANPLYRNIKCQNVVLVYEMKLFLREQSHFSFLCSTDCARFSWAWAIWWPTSYAMPNFSR